MLATCERTGKICHESMAAALEHARLLKMQDGYDGRPYECRSCGRWHVGRPYIHSRRRPAKRRPRRRHK